MDNNNQTLNQRWNLLFDSLNFKNKNYWNIKAQSKNILWALDLNSLNNINKININTALVEEYEFSNNKEFIELYISKDNQVWAFFIERIVGTNQKTSGFYTYNRKNDEFELVFHLLFDEDISYINISTIEETKEGNLWFIITKHYSVREPNKTSLIQFNPKNFSMNEFSLEDLNIDEFYPNYIKDFGAQYSLEMHQFALTSDNDRRIWVLGYIESMDNNTFDDYLLIEVNSENKKIKKVVKIEDFYENYQIPYGTIDIHYDSTGKLWINNKAWTYIRNKIKWNTTSDIEVYVMPSPLDDYVLKSYVADAVFSIYEDKDLWFSSFAGVAIFQQKGKEWCLVSRDGMLIDMVDQTIFGINENGLYQYIDE